jgi:hypothetical protein
MVLLFATGKLTQDVIEQLTIVVVGFKTLLNGRASLNSSIDVTIIKFLVEDQEWLVIINQWKDFISIWPR